MNDDLTPEQRAIIRNLFDEHPLTPDEQTLIERLTNEFENMPPVEVPWMIVEKLINRFDRLKRYRDRGLPSIIIEREYELIESALQELRDAVGDPYRM